VHVSTPTRIDLAGGTLDIWPISVLVPRAVTVNVAVDLRAHATVEPSEHARVTIVSEDRRRRLTRRLPLSENGSGDGLGLLLRLVAAFAPGSGLRLTTRAHAPAGAGLGGSSALAVAAGTALARFTGAALSRAALLERVMNVEAREIGVPTGNQDYLAAMHGGLCAWHHEVDGTRRERIPIPRGLEHRIVLAYTGEPRSSGYSNWDMFRRFCDGEARARRRFEAIAAIAREMVDALRAADVDEVGRLVGAEGRLRLGLAPSVTTPAIVRADRAARAAGALGTKVCGAGGGGCMVAIAREGRAEAVTAALAAAGALPLRTRIDRHGVRIERGAGVSARGAGSRPSRASARRRSRSSSRSRSR
jgi:D-glycero-alpha-D-manno-heptose-7-phosphate kinase